MHGIEETGPPERGSGAEAAPAAVTRVRSATVFVDDVERARRFYVDALGFEERSPPGAAQRVEVAPPGAATSLVLAQPSLSAMGVERASVARQRIGEPTGLILETEDVERTCRALRARGVVVGEPVPGAPEAAATFHDPDGNELVLVEAPARDAS